MDSLYNYLINLVFNTIGSEKALADVKEVETQMKFPWDTTPITQFDKKATEALAKTAKGAEAIGPAAKKASIGIDDFTNAMRRALIVAPVWMLIRTAIQSVTSLISSQIKFLLDMEDAMARIKIVGQGTAEEFDRLKNTLVALSAIYGVNASEALNAAKIFAQQGRSVSETLILTRAAMIGSKALGDDIKNVIDDLTAAIEGFNLPVDKATTIIDKWVAVEKQFAVTSRDLADATKIASASAHQLGITMSEYLGDVTAVIEVTRKSGSEAARGLSFIYARLLTTGKETVEQITKIPFYLDEQGRATIAVTDKLRSHSDILGELALKWNNLEKSEKLEIARALGSMRQMTILNALMQNYTRSIDARITALTSAGDAERAFGIMQETTRLKLTQVGAAWNNLTNALGDTSAFKGILDVTKELLMGITLLVDRRKGLTALIEEENAKELAGIEIRESEINSVEELIKAKEKLAAAPQTAENVARIEKIDTALKRIVTEFPGLAIRIEEGSEIKVKEEIIKISNTLAREKIELNVRAQFIPETIGLREEKAKIEAFLAKYAEGFTFGRVGDITKAKERLNIIDKQLLDIATRQTEELKKQYDTYLGQTEAQKILVEGLETEEDVSKELTEAEIERLNIERELIKAKELSGDNTVALILKEKELVEQSKYLYDEHEKNLRLRELENKLLSATISTNDKLIDHELDLARIRGASAKQLFELDTALKVQLYGENAIKSSLDYRLAKEKELTREKLHQNALSSDSMKIYEIAQEYGIEAAITIAKFINGSISFGYLREISGAYKIFEEKFADLNEQLKAQEFFAGKVAGKWEASLIPIPERVAINIPTSIAAIEKERAALAQTINVTPSFGGITINLPKGTLEEMATISGKKLTEILQGSSEFADLFDKLFWAESGKGK